MNVLILSAAAKVLLVRAFAEAAHRRGGQVIAADVAPDNAALFEADRALLLPRSDSPEFGEALIKACAAHSIRVVVPTRDAELAALTAAKAELAEIGVAALVPSVKALGICQDKRRFVHFCADQGMATPRTYAPGETPETFPVFVRPVRGAGGKGARLVTDAKDLPLSEDLLVQAVETAPEYTVDVLMDLAGRPLQAVARRRLMVRDGEAVKSQIEAARAAIEQELGWKVAPSTAITNLASQGDAGPLRRVARLGGRLLEAVVPEALEDGPPPGEWRQNRRARSYSDHLVSDLLVAVSGDFGGPKALRAIGQYVRDHSSTITAFYVSNVEQYLFQDGKQFAFYENVGTLPVTDRSVFIRPYALRRGTSPGLCGITAFLKNVKDGRVPTYNDSMDCQ